MSTEKIITQEIRFVGKYSKGVFQTLWYAYRSRGARVLFCLVIGFIGRLLLLSNANLIGIWVDTFCHDTSYVQCRPVAPFFMQLSSAQFVILLGSITAVGFLTTWFFRILFSALSAQAISQIYDETTYRASRFPLAFFDNTPTGRIVTRFASDYGNIFRLFGGPLAEFLSIIFDLLGMVILISLASPYYLAPVLLVACLNFIVYRRHRDHLRAARRELSASRSPSIAHFSETVQGASTIRSFNRQHSFSQRFSTLDSYFLRQKKQVVWNITNFSLQMNSLTALLLLLSGVMAYFFVHQGIVSVGSVGVAFGFITLSGNTVQMFFDWLTQFEEAMIGVERMDNYLRKDLEPGAYLPSAAHFPTPQLRRTAEEELQMRQRVRQHSRQDVQFKDVWFRYSPELPYVLKGVSFHVQAGEKFGIIGRTGSGKSSLIQALFALYPIEKGDILIGGKKPRLEISSLLENNQDLESFRQSISLISQDPVLFKGTLQENLVMRPLPEQQIFSALQKVGLNAWATTAGLRKIIEERGKNLSVGEKQLVCMARCLLQESSVVVMDEATSSVDPQSEQLMVQATQEIFADRTQLLIAHRLSTLQECDRILWLADGQVRMLGPANQVLDAFLHLDLQNAVH